MRYHPRIPRLQPAGVCQDPCQAEILDDDLKGIYRLFEALKTNEDITLEDGVIKLKGGQPPTNE